MRKLFLIFGIAGILLSSCSNDDSFSEEANNLLQNNEVKGVVNVNNKEKYLVNFAGVLSKATYEREDVREFLKKESLKQFDKNYDILYLSIKNEMIGDSSFRDILISYSSEEILEEIETNVPLLNILIPEIIFFDVKPENLNIEDNEIPVVVSKDSETSLFLNGKKELSLKKGEIPDFHVFVVNENSRVVVPENEKQSVKSAKVKSFAFKSPNYDGRLKNQEQSTTKSIAVFAGLVGAKAIAAFGYFNKDDGSIYQKAFQRDYIYYGITPKKQSGSLNRSVSEYISYVKINPNAYFIIADQKESDISTAADPYIKKPIATQRKRTLSEDELLDRMWTKGAYDFRFEIITSTDQNPQIIYLPLKPNEIWNFNIKHTQKHATHFRHSKNTYRIDPDNFTSKTVYLGASEISFGKWNLSEESLYRYVNIVEEDEGITTTRTITEDFAHVRSNTFKGDVKLDLGLGESKISGGASAVVTNTNTIKETNSVVVIRKEKSDSLGRVKIFYYDPIVEAKLHYSHRFVVHSYNTASVTFGISVK